MSKGSTPRPYNHDRFAAEFDRIFGRKNDVGTGRDRDAKDGADRGPVARDVPEGETGPRVSLESDGA